MLIERPSMARVLHLRALLAAWDLLNGRLAKPFDLGLRLSRTYWIVCPKATSTKPKITRFRDWLLAEAKDDVRRLRKMFASKLQSGLHRYFAAPRNERGIGSFKRSASAHKPAHPAIGAVGRSLKLVP
jgi:hypothetical protein